MKKLLSTLLTALLLLGTFIFPTLTKAQSTKPAIVMSPSAAVQVGTHKVVQLSMVNMGVPLKRVEITVRFSGDYDRNWGFSFEKANTEQYGLKYETHYFSDFAGRSDTKDMVVVFNATDPQGYNQGSAQIPLVNVTYVVVPGNFAATVVTEKTKLTDNKGNLLPSIDTFGSTNYTANVTPTSPTSSGPDLRSYNLSFNTDPLKMWWPTAPNSVQQIDAGIWKDFDGNYVQNLTNLSAEWQVDSNFIEITDTASSYLMSCSPVQMSNGRPCIHFAAHAKTKKTGTTYVSLRVTDNTTGHQIFNSYPVEIYSISSPTPSSSTTPSTSSPQPTPSFIPEGKVSTKEFKDVQQKVTYLQSQLDQQQKELDETQSLVGRISNFLKRLFRFK